MRVGAPANAAGKGIFLVDREDDDDDDDDEETLEVFGTSSAFQ